MSQAPADTELEGRVAIVTGASNGIGRAIAAELARRGSRVLGVARDETRLRSLAEETGASVLPVSLASSDAGPRIMEAASQLGPAAILVHGAGRGGYLDQPIFDQPLSGWRETMAVNLDAAFQLAQSVSRVIRDLSWGRIVMISSTAGEVGAPAMAPYCASKHGVIGLMRSVAQDIARFGGTCNAVLPSWVRTEMAERDAEREAGERGMTADAVWAERNAANPRGRIVTTDEVVALVAFLVSPAASGINGQAITISAGSAW